MTGKHSSGWPCGTENAYQRHVNYGEWIDDACRIAHNERNRTRRRRLVSGSGSYQQVMVAYLMKRDHERCGICRKAVQATSGPMRPSIDHIVPISRGGAHALENIQLAHWICNIRKRDGGSGEQLLLIG